MDVENNTDAVNSLTRVGIMDLVGISDVVDSEYIDADGAKSVDTSNDDELWGQSASVFAQCPEEHLNPFSGQGGSTNVPS